MNDYEAMFILTPDLSEQDTNQAVKTIEETITSNNGEIKNSSKWGKRQLSYPIAKHKEGFYQLVYFRIQPSEIKKLQDVYRLNDNILRVLITRAEKGDKK